jgi:MFS family permease
MQIVVALLSPVSGRLSDRYGSRVLSSLGLTLNAAGLIWFSTLNERSSYGAVLVSLLILGLGMALFSPPNVSSVMGSVPTEKRGVANGIRMTTNQTAVALSVPFSLVLMTLAMPYNKLSQTISSAQVLNSNELPLFLKAINHTCLILGIIVLLAIIPSLLRGPRENAAPKI